MATEYGTNIFGAVEHRVQQRYTTLTDAQQRILADPIKQGQFFMWAMTDEAASRYATTQQRGAVNQRILSRSVRYVTHGDIPPALQNDMAPMLLEDCLRVRHSLEFLLLSYLPDTEAAIITIMGDQIVPHIFTIADQTVRPPDPSRTLLPDSGLYDGLATKLPRDVQTASANHPDGKRYWYFSDSLGTLGRLVVQPRPDGQSQIVSEFAEGDSDPEHSAQRAALFRGVTDSVLFDETPSTWHKTNSRTAKSEQASVRFNEMSDFRADRLPAPLPVAIGAGLYAGKAGRPSDKGIRESLAKK